MSDRLSDIYYMEALERVAELEAENKRLSLDYISAVGQTQMHLEENKRIAAELQQCQEQNDRLVSELLDLINAALQEKE